VVEHADRRAVELNTLRVTPSKCATPQAHPPTHFAWSAQRDRWPIQGDAEWTDALIDAADGVRAVCMRGATVLRRCAGISIWIPWPTPRRAQLPTAGLDLPVTDRAEQRPMRLEHRPRWLDLRPLKNQRWRTAGCGGIYRCGWSRGVGAIAARSRHGFKRLITGFVDFVRLRNRASRWLPRSDATRIRVKPRGNQSRLDGRLRR
jgi:hypothetical protein